MGKSVLWFLFFCFIAGCAAKEKAALPVWKITFFPLGAKLHTPSTEFGAAVKSVTAFNSDGLKVARLIFPVPPRQVESLYFEWGEGESYRFETVLSSADIITQNVAAPDKHARGSLSLSIPYGAALTGSQVTSQTSLLLHNSDMTATVVVRNGNMDGTADFRVRLCLPPTIAVVSLPAGWIEENRSGITQNHRSEDVCLSTSGQFSVAGEVWYRELRLKIHEVPDNGNGVLPRIRCTVRFEGDDAWEEQVELRVRSATVSEIAGFLSIESVQMPTDAAGVVDVRRRSDTLTAPRPFLGLGRQAVTDAYEPVAYQTVKLRNQGTETVHVVVSAINRVARTGDVVSFLAPPRAIAGTDRSVAFATLPPGMLSSIPLPIYFDAISATPGDYQRDIEVKIWGSESKVLRAERPLQIIVPNRHAWFVSGLAVIVSLIGLGVMLRFHKRFFLQFSTKQLIVTALFGATVFVCVIVPSTLFLNLIRALLGPVSVLLTGLINETVYYALLTALLIYIYGSPEERKRTTPHDNARGSNGKPIAGSGVIFLVSAVRLLLGAVTFGLFTPMEIIYTTTSVLLLETAYWLAHRRGVLMWALAFGVGDALAVYIDFQLSIVFYRLFYAEWYILLRIFVEGFAYTFIGVLLGAQLGRGLWRVAD